MTKHIHQYKTISFWTLTLPDYDRFYEAFVAWQCSCGSGLWSTGTFHESVTAMSPDVWQKIAEDERRQRTPVAQSAVRTERQHTPLWDKYTTFARRTPWRA